MNSASPIRIIQAFDLSPLRSQAIYHAIAECFTEDSPDTICLVRPTEPYICIGYHQDPQRELDLEELSRFGLQLIRRQVGGGAVYLDANQVFLQWIFSPNSLPVSIEARYRLFIEPIVSTYQNIGIPAEMRPVNDIQVRGRKIGGCGAARIGEAELLVSSFIFDIDLATMASVLKVETLKMRDKLYQNLTEYVTSIARELGSPSRQEPIVDTYLEQVEARLQREIYFDNLSPLEKEQLASTESLLASDQWTYGGGGRRVAGVKIQQGVAMHHAAFKSSGGLIRWVVFLADDNIIDATLEGDFTIYPLDAPVLLANALLGRRLDAVLRSEWETIFRTLVQQSPGVSASDMFAPLEMIATELASSR